MFAIWSLSNLCLTSEVAYKEYDTYGISDMCPRDLQHNDYMGGQSSKDNSNVMAVYHIMGQYSPSSPGAPPPLPYPDPTIPPPPAPLLLPCSLPLPLALSSLSQV